MRIVFHLKVYLLFYFCFIFANQLDTRFKMRLTISIMYIWMLILRANFEATLYTLLQYRLQFSRVKASPWRKMIT